MRVFRRHISSPQGFAKRAAGFSLAPSGWRTTLAAGLKLSAYTTKADTGVLRGFAFTIGQRLKSRLFIRGVGLLRMSCTY